MSRKSLCSGPGKEPTWLKSLKHQIQGLIVKGFLTREDNFRNGLRLLTKYFGPHPALLMSSPNFRSADTAICTSSVLHSRPEVVIFCSDFPWGRVSQTLSHVSLKVLKETALLFPFRNVIVRRFQYMEVILGTPNYFRSIFWWSCWCQITRLLEHWPTVLTFGKRQ